LIGNGYADLAAGIVEQAMAAGATDAECTISEGEEFSANVRLRELETLKEAGSRAVGLRILQGRHTGSAHTSDFSADGLRHMVRSAIELAAITSDRYGAPRRRRRIAHRSAHHQFRRRVLRHLPGQPRLC